VVTPHHQPRANARAHHFKIHDAIAIATSPRPRAPHRSRAHTSREYVMANAYLASLSLHARHDVVTRAYV
jgi:hypothetical protein